MTKVGEKTIHNCFIPDAEFDGLRGKYFSTTLVMLNAVGEFVTGDCDDSPGVSLDGVDVRGPLVG